MLTYAVVNYFCYFNFILDGSKQIQRYSTPEVVDPEVATPLTRLGIVLSLLGCACLFYMRNKQPQRTRNLYLSYAMIVFQLIHVRFSLNPSQHDWCLTKNIVLVSMLSTEKIVMLVQLFLYKLRAQKNKKLSASIASVIANKDIDTREATPFYHLFDTLPGAVILFTLHLLPHVVGLLSFTEISWTDPEPCNTKNHFPGVSQVAMSVGVPTLISVLIYGVINSASAVVFIFQITFWVMMTNIFVVLSLWMSILYMLKLLNVQDIWIRNFNFVSFSLFIGMNIFIDCVLPVIYYHLFYKPKSQVTRETKALFILAEKQPFSLEKLTEFASTELESESVLLYHVVKALKAQRADVLNSDFKSSERLATFIFTNYIQGGWKTLSWYDLAHITKEVKSPLELLENETIIDDLEIGVRENIILPMFARMQIKK
jgi:hypothetical protein